MTRRLPIQFTLVIAAAVLDSCVSDAPTLVGVVGDEVGVSGVTVVSDTIGSASYVSLPPGTVQEDSDAVITNQRTGISITQLLVDGGFDPVAIDAVPGDGLEVSVAPLSGPTLRFAGKVPLSRAPAVVRTAPTRKKKAVPLNTRIEIVFTEPVNGTTVIGGVRLMQGQIAVAGFATLDPSGIVATFTPDNTLQPLTTYTIVVSSVLDLDGDPLAGTFASEFDTEASAPASPAATHVEILAQSVHLGTYSGLNAQLQNAAGENVGSVLPSGSVSWASSDPSIVSVGGPPSSNAYAFGHAAGTATITASYGGLTGTIGVTVTAEPASSVEIIGRFDAYVGDTLVVFARAYLATLPGGHFRDAAAAWTVSDPTKAKVLEPGVVPWFVSIEALDTGTVTLTATALGKSATLTLEFTRPTTTMKVLVPGFAPSGINDSGQIIGAQESANVAQPVLYQDGTLTSLGFLPGFTQCWPTAINNSGAVVGHCLAQNPGRLRAFIWKAGMMTDLGALPGDDRSYARAINDSGDVVGYSSGPAGVRAVRWHAEAIEELPMLTGRQGSGALAINSSGTVVGWARTGDDYTAVAWRGGAVESLGLPGNAVGIDDAGMIVVNNYARSWLWRADGIIDLGVDFWGITRAGLVFGGMIWGGPLIWQPNGARDLGTIPKNASGAVWGANDRGQAVGIVNGYGVIWDLNQPAAMKRP